MDPAPAAARVAHRALAHFFDGHSATLGRYVPSRRLAFEYPGDGVEEAGAADDVVPCGEDANMLLGAGEREAFDVAADGG